MIRGVPAGPHGLPALLDFEHATELIADYIEEVPPNPRAPCRAPDAVDPC